MLAQVRQHPQRSAFLLILLFWAIVLVGSGALFSGYHFTDDHEIPVFHASLTVDRIPFWDVVGEELQRDYGQSRFRPFYFIHRIAQTQVFGLNMLLWATYTGLLGVFSSFFLYSFARLLQFSLWDGLLFAGLATLGEQSAIWWQLGPAETLGLFLLSAALILAALTTTSPRYWVGLEIGFTLCGIGMTLTKESFILLVPALILLQVWLWVRLGQLGWLQALRRTVPSALLLTGCALLEILFIVTQLNHSPGDKAFSLTAVLGAIGDLHYLGTGWLILAALGAIGAAYCGAPWARFHPKLTRTAILQNGLPLLACYGLWIMPQALIYSGGVSHRYLLPGVVAPALLSVFLYRVAHKIHPRINWILLGIIGLSLALRLQVVVPAVAHYAREGHSTTQLLHTIASHTRRDDPILLVTNPRNYLEWNLSFHRFLTFAFDRPNLYFTTTAERPVLYTDRVLEWYDNKTLQTLPDKQSIGCITVYPELNRGFLRRSTAWFQPDRYQAFVFGNFNRNFNLNSEIHLYCQK